MAVVDQNGNIAFTNEEAIYIAICVSLAQTMVLGKTEYLASVAGALRKKMLKMDPGEIDGISIELSKCAAKDGTLQTEIKSATHSDLVDIEIVGAVDLGKPPQPPPSKEKQERSNPNWN